MADLSWLNNLINQGGSIASAVLPYQSTQDVMEKIQSTAGTFKTGAEQLAEKAKTTAAFQPFAVKTGMGSTQVGAGGGVTQTLSPEAQALSSGLLQQATSLMGQQPVTAQGLFQQMQQAQAPEIQRQQQQLAQQLQAQGRGGVQTAMYGGTPEQLAMQKAIQEQQSQNLLSAMQLAPQLQGQQLANVQAALAGAYTPQAQQLATLTPALSAAQIAQSAGASGAEALTNLGIQGLTSEAALQSALAELEKGRASALGTSLSGMFTSDAASRVDYAQTLTGIKDAIQNLLNIFG